MLNKKMVEAWCDVKSLKRIFLASASNYRIFSSHILLVRPPSQI